MPSFVGPAAPLVTSTVAASISLPSPWYQIRLRCTQVTKACPYDVGGVSLSGMPGVVVGHNRTVAWGLGPALPSTARLAVVPPKKTQRNIVARLTGGAEVALQWKREAGRSNLSGLLALNRVRDEEGVEDAADQLALPFALVWADSSGGVGQVPSEPEPHVAATERSPLADLLVPSLLPVEVSTQFAEQGKDTLSTWNREMSAGVPASAYFAAVWRNVLALTFHDELPKAQWPDGSARWMIVIRHLLAKPSATWWDNLSTPSTVERRDDILRQAMEDARDELTRIRARDVAQWDWSDLHAAPLRNPTLSGWVFERGPVEVDGSNDTIEATAWDAADGYTAVAAPAARLVMHVAAPDSSRWVVSTGASGHTFSDHYTDQVDLWAAGRDLPWRSTAAAVDKQAHSTLTLTSPTRLSSVVVPRKREVPPVPGSSLETTRSRDPEDPRFSDDEVNRDVVVLVGHDGQQFICVHERTNRTARVRQRSVEVARATAEAPAGVVDGERRRNHQPCAGNRVDSEPRPLRFRHAK